MRARWRIRSRWHSIAMERVVGRSGSLRDTKNRRFDANYDANRRLDRSTVLEDATGLGFQFAG
ncbi:MAG: hypothetical protein EOR09_32005 [Mesorhizobium sp.]|nr:MAG: hypothetical protein EOR09_32005 [Mesorhizobium sp.]